MTTDVTQDRSHVLRRRWPEVACAALLLLMGFNLLSVVARKSITIDETSAIPAGYYHLTERAFHINSEHPPLPKLLTALPLLFTKIQAPSIYDLSSKTYSQRTVEATRRFWQANRASFQKIFFWARVPMVLVTLATGLVIFAFALLLFGARAAVLSVALFAFEPNILAHGRIVKDIHTAFAYVLFCYTLYLYWSTPTFKRALLVGLTGGVATVVKFSMFVVGPLYFLAACALVAVAPSREFKRSVILGQLAASWVVALVVINGAYLFSHQSLTAVDVLWLQQNSPALASWLLPVVRSLGWILPPYFLFGISGIITQQAGDHHVFLLGSYSERGWWYYFPTAFALKTTLPFLLITVSSLAWAVWQLVRKRDERFFFLLAPVAAYMAMAMWTSIQIGIRHLIPIFPFLFILGGALLERLLRANRAPAAARASVIIALLWISMEATRAYPDYIPFMNQLASRGPRWHYLSDSNVEWGDDIGALADYLKTRGAGRVRAALLGGSVLLPLYGVEYVDLLAPPGSPQPATQYVALGASFLNGTSVPGWSEGSRRETKEQQRNFFADYRHRTPEAVFGGSIYLYRVSE